LPPTPYEACEKKAGRVSSLSLVRYRGTDYSVPTAYGHREVVIRGYVDAVVISCGAEVIARHPRSYERGSTMVTSNLPFDEWTSVFASDRLTGALLDRLTHHVHILEMNGDSYRLKQSKRRRHQPRATELTDNQPQA